MHPERWKQVEELLQLALRLPSGERTAFLHQACAGDSSLEHEVHSLLISQRESDGFLDRPAFELAAEQIARGDSEQLLVFDAQLGQSVGPYRLVEPLGAGGMGEVWRAEQSGPIRRIVALKLIKPGMDTRAVVARFDSERQALAMMDHPNIAKVFDAGTTSAGRPFFVMELVPGVPITTYCDDHRLTIKQRLVLLLQVCDGVQHAHQKAIIHRDLKPSNILVEEVDGKPMPKIIDFGLAKAITEAGSERSVFTELGMMVGTPSYMSPEQAGGFDSTVDTRTDVYSLGVILFELLVGTPPFAFDGVRRSGAEALLREIREVEATRPSLKFATLGPAAEDVASTRAEKAAALLRQLRGDLDWITLKSIEKDRERRYSSVSELAADIRRHLDDQPVFAGPPSATYRGRKFVRRHRVGVTVASVICVLVVAGVATTLVQARRVARERDRALRAEQVANAVTDFLQNDLLAQASSRAQAGTQAAPDPDLKVRTALDRAAAHVANKFGSQPVVEASIRHTLGLTYYDLNLYPEAQLQLERAVKLRQSALGPKHPDTLTSMHALGVLYNYQSRYAQAEALLSQVLATRQRVLGNEHKDTLATMSDLAETIAYEGDPARAAPIFAEVLEADGRILGEKDPATLSALDNLSGAYRDLGRWADAQVLLEREWELNRRVLGPEHPDTINSMLACAAVYRALGNYKVADPLFLATIDSVRRAMGEEHWEIANALSNLAISYRAQGRYAEADPLFKQALASLQRTLGPEHTLTWKVAFGLGESYRKQRRLREAESIFGKVLEARRRVLGNNNPNTAQVLAALGEVKLEQHSYAEAERFLREAIQIREQKSPDTWERYWAQSMLGASLWGLEKHSDARPLLTSGYQGMLERRNSIPAEYRGALEQAREWASQP